MLQPPMPESPAPKKKPQKISLPPKAIEWAEALAGDTDLGVQEILRTAVYRGLAAIASDVSEIKQRNVKVLVEHKLRMTLQQLGMGAEEIESLVKSKPLGPEDDD